MIQRVSASGVNELIATRRTAWSNFGADGVRQRRRGPVRAEANAAHAAVCSGDEHPLRLAADEGMAFSWHQDSGYVKARDPETTHPPYLTCWCTLDDVSVVNGTVHVLGLDEGGTRDTIVTHGHDRETNDLIGYTGDLAGAAIEAPAGSERTRPLRSRSWSSHDSRQTPFSSSVTWCKKPTELPSTAHWLPTRLLVC